MKNRRYKFKTIAMTLLLGTLVFFLGGASELVKSPTVKAQNIADTTSTIQLPTVGDVENLKKLLDAYMQYGYGYDELDYGVTKEVAVVQMSMKAEEAAPTAGTAADRAADFSETNKQVVGVDEADIVKTDGKYIYKLQNDRVAIVKAMPADDMKLVSTIPFATNFRPQELFIDKSHLVLIGAADRHYSNKLSDYYDYYMPRTQVVVYNIIIRENPVKVRQLELEGDYISARKINNSLYVATDRYIDYYLYENDKGLVPAYRDSFLGEDYNTISLDKVRYFPGYITPSYLTIAGVNLNNSNEAAQVECFLGGGENLYASPKAMFIALTDYNYNHYYPMPMPGVRSGSLPVPLHNTETTKIFSFTLKPNGKFDLTAEGEVPGRIINQFSMDQYNEYFRIATTTGNMWATDENISKNNVYILDEKLKLTGKIEGIAPGERIYSTRFMGDRAYMVTFRDTDPFFVLDLKNPAEPSILGKLKLPGYSDYLHPYDENHIIGFGKDTVLEKRGDGEAQAYYQGMKIAMFDVTDVTNPKLKSQTVIGDRGTDSELLEDHKALLFNKDKNILAFPITVMEKTVSGPGSSAMSYGEFSFNGAYVYNINLQKGFELKGRLTHLTQEDYNKAGDYWYDSDRNIRRIIYIGDNLYTISENKIKAHNLDTLKDIGEIEL